jgi:hypothetical protein
MEVMTDTDSSGSEWSWGEELSPREEGYDDALPEQDVFSEEDAPPPSLFVNTRK